MNNKVSFDCVAAWWQGLGPFQKSAFADDPLRVSEFLILRASEIARNTFVTPVSDEEAVELLVQQTDYVPWKSDTVVSWRKYAKHMGCYGPVAYRVKQGFTLKTHASLVGPCFLALNYLQDWKFTDTPTVDSLVFWVPRLVDSSIGMTIDQMLANIARESLAGSLPEHDHNSFGSIALLFALILAHFKRTGERAPLNCFNAISDTVDTENRNLFVGDFRSPGPRCRKLWIVTAGREDTGCFILKTVSLPNPLQG